MGWLEYGSEGRRIDIDDRTLAHIQIVVATKLRRGEGFVFVWNRPEGEGGRTCVWLSPAIQLRFEYDGDPSEIRRDWLELLFTTASSVHGLRVLDEPAVHSRATVNI